MAMVDMKMPELVEIAPAPKFSFTVGGPSLATIYSSHYARLQAVVAAARSGDQLLIKLALEQHDKHGSRDVPN